MLSFNINGTRSTRLQSLVEWPELFASYDLVCLQETRSVRREPLLGMLASSHVCVAHASSSALHGQAGTGLAVYLNTAYAAGMRAWPHASGNVLGVSFTVGSTKAHVFNVYRPPSARLGPTLEALTECMSYAAIAAGDLVFVCGDFNAHLPGRDDRPMGSDGHPLFDLPARRPSPGHPNRAGRELVDWCLSANMLLLTGRLGDADPQGQALSSSSRGSTRCDHCLVAPSVYAWVQAHNVLSEVDGSDHLPLHIVLRLPGAGSSDAGAGDFGGSRGEEGTMQPTGTRLLWREGQAEAFTAALEDPPAQRHLEACRRACTAGENQLAIQELHAAIFTAARQAGMPCITPGDPPQRRHHPYRLRRPWFDAECRAAQATLLATPADQRRPARAHFAALLQRKQRQYASQQYQRFLNVDKRDAKSVWRQLRRRTTALPPPPAARTAQHFATAFAGQPCTPQPAPVDEHELELLLGEPLVAAAMKTLRNGAAPGLPGVPLQAYKAAPLRQALVAVLQSVHCAGVEPPAMQEAHLCPIYKQKGSPMEPVNFRPIVVSAVLHKIYATCVLWRIRTLLQSQADTLFPRQAGFLPGKDTMLNVFALHALIAYQAKRKLPLHAVLVDVSKAYDSVLHSKLFSTLYDHGLPAHLVAGVVGMYAGLQYKLAMPGQACHAIDVGIGVKQGCPLSPFLFNLYIAGLAAHLGTSVVNEGGSGFLIPPLQTAVCDFLYADDLVLVDGTSHARLQQSLTQASSYLAPLNLHLNVPKCVGISFNHWYGPERHQRMYLTIEGTRVPYADDDGGCGVVYLGTYFDREGSLEGMATRRTQCFVTAFHAAMSNLRAAPHLPTSVPLVMRMLHVVAAPAGLYGCDVWGLSQLSLPTAPVARDTLLPKLFALSDPLEHQRCLLLRRHFRLPLQVPHLLLLHELGCRPFGIQYVLRAVGLYNRLLKAGSSYRELLLMHACDALRAEASPKTLWLRGLLVVLEGLQPGRAGHWSRTFTQGLPIDAKAVRQLLHNAYDDYVASFRGVYEGEGSRLGFYFREVADHTAGQLPKYLTLPLSHDVVRACMRFRLGCHYLRVHTGRWLTPPLPRERRLCQRCAARCLDDEMHCLFACQHRDLRRARARLCAVVFGGSGHVPASISHMFKSQAESPAHLARVARFVAHCHEVTARCHEAGGTDLAPRWQHQMLSTVLALLPETELDLFDSDDD